MVTLLELVIHLLNKTIFCLSIVNVMVIQFIVQVYKPIFQGLFENWDLVINQLRLSILSGILQSYCPLEWNHPDNS